MHQRSGVDLSSRRQCRQGDKGPVSRERVPSGAADGRLVELGYAIREMGWDDIVMVMNTIYPPVEQLPFDMRGRRVLPYALPETPSEPKADVRRDLQHRLKEAIVRVLHEHRAQAHDGEKARRQTLIQFARNSRDEALS